MSTDHGDRRWWDGVKAPHVPVEFIKGSGPPLGDPKCGYLSYQDAKGKRLEARIKSFKFDPPLFIHNDSPKISFDSITGTITAEFYVDERYADILREYAKEDWDSFRKHYFGYFYPDPRCDDDA